MGAIVKSVTSNDTLETTSSRALSRVQSHMACMGKLRRWQRDRVFTASVRRVDFRVITRSVPSGELVSPIRRLSLAHPILFDSSPAYSLLSPICLPSTSTLSHPPPSTSYPLERAGRPHCSYTRSGPGEVEGRRTAPPSWRGASSVSTLPALAQCPQRVAHLSIRSGTASPGGQYSCCRHRSPPTPRQRACLAHRDHLGVRRRCRRYGQRPRTSLGQNPHSRSRARQAAGLHFPTQRASNSLHPLHRACCHHHHHFTSCRAHSPHHHPLGARRKARVCLTDA